VGVHFFNPVGPGAGARKGDHFPEDLVTHRDCFRSRALGRPVVKSQDRTGFIVSTLLIPYLPFAIQML
jgi:3-hydroxybutyryl-CoA dehydrogenase